MGKLREIRHFRTNPVELAIFLVVSLIFLNSVYNLVYDRHSFQFTALAPMTGNPASEGRSLASNQPAFLNMEVKCDGNTTQDTGAAKVRLTGSLCGLNAPTESTKLMKTVVVNNANKFTATVFTDLTNGKFSTDYIPLNTGKNPIRMEFAYQGGRIVSQELTLNKN